MTKRELKNSLSKIQPREDLVNDTIVKMRQHKADNRRRFTTPRYSQGMRLASAICTLTLVFCFGFAVAKQSPDLSKARTLADLAVVTAPTDSVTTHILEPACANGYILINGNVSSFSFLELTQADKDNNATHRCKVIITAEGLVEKSDELSVDLHKTSEEFEAEIVFYEESIMDAFIDQSTQEMLLCLAPTANGNWSIIEFAPFEK